MNLVENAPAKDDAGIEAGRSLYLCGWSDEGLRVRGVIASGVEGDNPPFEDVVVRADGDDPLREVLCEVIAESGSEALAWYSAFLDWMTSSLSRECGIGGETDGPWNGA